MKDDPRRDSFFSTLKENQDYEGNRGNLEWIRQQFLKSMRGTDWQGNQLAALVNIGMGFENPQVYTSRLLDACRSTNISITTSATSSPVVKELILNWATKLPVTVQNQLQPHVKDLCDPVDQCNGGNIQDFIDLVIRHIKTEPERIVVPRYPCGWCSEDLVVSCSCQTAKRLKMQHQKDRILPRQEHRPVSKMPDDEHEECRKKGLCFKCKQTWDPKHRCHMPQMVNMALVPEVRQVEERDSEYLESILDAAVLGATMALTGHKNPEEAIEALRVTAPLTLNEGCVKAYILTPSRIIHILLVHS